MIFTNMDTPLHCTEIVAIELKQNSNPTNFDPLLKKFYKRPDATIHTNEIAQCSGGFHLYLSELAFSNQL